MNFIFDVTLNGETIRHELNAETLFNAVSSLSLELLGKQADTLTITLLVAAATCRHCQKEQKGKVEMLIKEKTGGFG